jgi:hypothetical protein
VEVLAIGVESALGESELEREKLAQIVAEKGRSDPLAMVPELVAFGVAVGNLSGEAKLF